MTEEDRFRETRLSPTAWETGQQQLYTQHEKPFGPFDDVQCHACGHYIYVENSDSCCKNCGTEYDWEWNVATGRISRQSIPSDVVTQ